MHTASEIPSVNFHLWKPCNMSCKFCFATFQDFDRDILPKGEAVRHPKQRDRERNKPWSHKYCR